MNKYFKTALVLIASFILILALAAKQVEASEASELCNSIALTFMDIKEAAELGVKERVFVREFVDAGFTFDYAVNTVRFIYNSPMSPEELGYEAFTNCMEQQGEPV